MRRTPCAPGRKEPVETFLFDLQQYIDQMSSHIKRTARDYLAEDRLIRRVSHGGQSFAAELRGYQDRYHPTAAVHHQGLATSCSCERRQPCSHAAALLMDMEQHRLTYPEVPWDVVRVWATDRAWRWDAHFPWDLVPDSIPDWRLPFRAEAWETVEPRFAQEDYIPLSRDPRARIWAEADPSWWERTDFQTHFRTWVRGARLDSADPALCAALIWMQPELPVVPLITAGLMGRPSMAGLLMGWLFQQRPVLAPTPERVRRALESLTMTVPDAAEFLWGQFPEVDPHHLALADALYLAGRPQHAVRTLEQHLPTENQARRAARARLVEWLDLEAGIPHRTALALETGQWDFVLPVRHLIGDAEWQALEEAVRTRAGGGGAMPG